MKHKPKLAVRVKQLASDLFEVPAEPTGRGMSVTVTDGREVYMDGCREILVYKSDRIRVSTSIGCVDVIGSELDIPKYSDGELTVRGVIFSLSIAHGE